MAYIFWLSNNCELLTENADKTGAINASLIGQITIGDLPPLIRQEVLELEIGQVTHRVIRFRHTGMQRLILG